jgi:hypothetical protein
MANQSLNELIEEYKLSAIGSFLRQHMEKNPKAVGFIVEKLGIVHPCNYSESDLANSVADCKERLDEMFQSILG